MKYMCLIYWDEARGLAIEGDEEREMLDRYRAFGAEAAAAGVLVTGDALVPVEEARTVRVRSGETLATDGPFAETKEQLGGYYLLDVPDMETAIRWASKIPDAANGSIEVRALKVFDD